MCPDISQTRPDNGFNDGTFMGAHGALKRRSILLLHYLNTNDDVYERAHLIHKQ